MNKKSHKKNLQTNFLIAATAVLVPLCLLISSILTGSNLDLIGNANKNSKFTSLQLSGCPASSGQSYENITPSGGHRNTNVAADPNFNLYLHGWTKVDQGKQLVDYGGDTDPNPPPSFGSVFMGRMPQITDTFIVNDYDYANNRPIPGQSATPAWPVHLIALDGRPGEPLLGLNAGRFIRDGYTLLVLYASDNQIMFTYADSDGEPPYFDGYPIYFVDLCVDPNLVALYNQDDAGGRQGLPAIRPGQVFGYTRTDGIEPKAAIRDTGSYMDPRSRKDWWQFGPPAGPTYAPPASVVIPTPTAAAPTQAPLPSQPPPPTQPPVPTGQPTLTPFPTLTAFPTRPAGTPVPTAGAIGLPGLPLNPGGPTQPQRGIPLPSISYYLGPTNSPNGPTYTPNGTQPTNYMPPAAGGYQPNGNNGGNQNNQNNNQNGTSNNSASNNQGNNGQTGQSTNPQNQYQKSEPVINVGKTVQSVRLLLQNIIISIKNFTLNILP